MDVKYINPFLNGTLEVLKKMASVDSIAGKPYTKTDSTACGDVSGIIGITGNAVGSLAISFSEQSICAITSNMLGETYKDICRDVFDTVGELTNMISGVARTYMEREGLTVYAAIPTVVYGKNHVIMHILKSPSIVIPFSTRHGQFFVDVSIVVPDQADVVLEGVEAPINKIYKADTSLSGRPTSPPAPFQAKPVVNTVTSPLSPFQARPAVNSVTRPAPIQNLSRPTMSAPPQPTPPPDAAPSPTPSRPLTQEEKIVRARENLDKFTAQRNETIRLLNDNPFMELKQRQNLKKLLPALEDKIKRLKLDIQAIESLSKMSPDEIDNPTIGKHYQNYPHRK